MRRSGSFANDPRPPSPVNLSVYIDNSRVSLSPQSVGAGPVVFIVTNQADKSESLAIVHKGRTSIADALADTGPINPQATAQVKVNFRPRGLHDPDLDRGRDPGPEGHRQAGARCQPAHRTAAGLGEQRTAPALARRARKAQSWFRV